MLKLGTWRERIAAGCALMALGASSGAGAEDFRGRNGGPAEAAMLARSVGTEVEGLDFFRPVLSGVLYRAGFRGGDRERTGLSDAQRRELCEAGFSQARYADFGKNTAYGTTACDSGTLTYASARSSRPADILRDVHRVIEDPAAGPMLVHCMWGVHSSGALAAMALVQFCGWSEARAKTYWNETRNDAPCSGGCDAWIDAKFAKFTVDPALAISDAERRAICPQ
jgi:hypothetical protein